MDQNNIENVDVAASNESSESVYVEDREKKKRLIICIVILALVATAALAAMAWTTQNSSAIDSWFDPNASNDSYIGKTEEQIIADLNAKVEEGMMNISVVTNVRYDADRGEYLLRAENIEANHVDQKIKVVLDETGETIYESGAIAPGQSLNYVKFNEDLEPGVHAATVEFTGYDRETHEPTGTLAAQVKVHAE